jgi:hypothetical protein
MILRILCMRLEKFSSTYSLWSHIPLCRSITTYCDESSRNHSFVHGLNPWNTSDVFYWRLLGPLQPPFDFFYLAHCFLYGVVVTLCQKAMDSIGSCITRPFFTLLIDLLSKANNRCCIQHQQVWETYCSWIIEVDTHSNFSSSLRSIHTKLPHIPSSVKDGVSLNLLFGFLL